ncbi:uncharacterized protein LOC118995979 isoform X3 [Sturnira hondurensis]|uniref:uncharacterized protein LOC118995979 isoform X3 n=1 Tax=Sturnira hondurensis TaxID=192404 RepID=UPI00187B0ECA|nr:uncharacterized protein LOC118995979 isoform X3 [Sturnira hondurensis]
MFLRTEGPEKIAPGFPATSTLTLQPVCRGRGSRAGSRWGGGAGRRFWPSVSAPHPHPGDLARGHIRCGRAAKLPATPWIGWVHGALCQATLGPLSLYASWAVLGKKLAASVNILSEASSLYFWNGEIEEATEILLVGTSF